MAAYFLKKQTYFGQLLWHFTCGAAFCLITASFWYAASVINQTDASGFETSKVLIIKGIMHLLVIFASIRAFRLLIKHQF